MPSHDEFDNLNLLELKKNNNSIIFDVKDKIPKGIFDLRL